MTLCRRLPFLTRERWTGFVLRAAILVFGTPVILTGQKPAADAPKQPQTLTELQQMIERGHATEALQLLNGMAENSSVPPGVHRLRGVALYTQGKMAAAEQAFGAAVQQDAADNDAVLMRGITLFRLGRPAAAIPLLESVRAATGKSGRTEQKNATPVDPSYVLALCYVDTRRYDDARGAFAAQFGFAADSAQAYLLTARMLLRREYVPIAQEYARKALALSPQLPLAHQLLGEAELAANHLDPAILEFEAERKLNPLEPKIYDRLGDAFVRRGDLDQARDSLQEAILLDPNSTGSYILLGKVLLKRGDATSAAGFLEHARAMDSQNYMTHSLLGQAYRLMGRIDDARREADSAQRLQAATEPKLDDVH